MSLGESSTPLGKVRGLGSARDLAGRFGIDVADEAFWTASLDVIRRRIDDFCSFVR